MDDSRGSALASGADGVIPPAELVLQNSRLSGARRALQPHVTVVGQAPGCDVRLDVQGVSPLHCLLVQSASGLVLRDLQTDSGTYVNGERATERSLHDGDLMTVGPFRFKVRLPARAAGPDAAALHREKEALRIQAAAVAAQQAALTEAELRLEQRRVALDQQESQLAAHLEEKRQRLTELRDQARQARADVQAERAAHEQRVTATTRELSAARREVAQDRQQALAERRRLVDLRQRLKRRWHRHWAAERAAMRQREQQLEAQRGELEQEQERLQRAREELHGERLRFNGEAELGGRNLEAAWEELHRQQRRWQQECADREELFDQEARRLIEREIGLAAAERSLTVETAHWQQRRQTLWQECESLECRVSNLRDKLQGAESEVGRLEAVIRSLEGRARSGTVPPAPSPIPSAPPPAPMESGAPEVEESLRQRFAALETIAGELADQRLWLVEQCGQFAQAQHEWQSEHDRVARQLEDLGLRLQEREHTLNARQVSLQALECGLRHRQGELDQRERALEGWQTRLCVRTAAWEAGRDRLLADVQAREELAQRRLARLSELRGRWHQRQRRHLERLRAERAACERIGLEYVALREEVLSRRAVLEQEQRTVSEWALAVEECRQECLEKSADSVAVARQMEVLRRRWATITAAAERDLDEERRALQAEAARLRGRQVELEQRADRQAAQEAELSDRQAAWEQQQAEVEEERRQVRHEAHRHRLEHNRQEQELKELRDELERVGRVLLEDGKPQQPALPLAA
jgi:pSer/pThr/pTyr-binding forkhead associated (FHA) protein